MINQHCDLERFDTKHPDLCTASALEGTIHRGRARPDRAGLE